MANKNTYIWDFFEDKNIIPIKNTNTLKNKLISAHHRVNNISSRVLKKNVKVINDITPIETNIYLSTNNNFIENIPFNISKVNTEYYNKYIYNLNKLA